MFFQNICSVKVHLLFLQPLSQIRASCELLPQLSYGLLFLILPSCSSEVGKEQSREDQAHVMDMHLKKNEPSQRKSNPNRGKRKTNTKLYCRISRERYREGMVSRDKYQISHGDEKYSVFPTAQGIQSVIL